MREYVRKVLCWCLALVLCFGTVPAQSLAEQVDAITINSQTTPQVVEGTYAFTSTPNNSQQQSDAFTFREDCFMHSSFLGCSNLAELAAQVSLASASCFVDENGSSTNETDRNVSSLFQAMGFKDVEANSYNRANTLPSSVGAVVGQRSLVTGNKTYTLITVAIRGAGYQREWVGNVTVGEGSIHQGFKDARDEVLRFVRNYIQEHGITGDLKVWVSGHSRGGTVANLVAGFFAGGGISYLGDAVSITPEDVYCYTFAAPSAIKAETSKVEELSVSAARDGDYALDTPGDAYQTAVDGALDPSDASVYGGIRNYASTYDIMPEAFPASWGFVRYGANLAPDVGLVGTDDMATELADLSPATYQQFVSGGDPRGFAWVKPDVLSIDINNPSFDNLPLAYADGEGDSSIEEFLARRIAGIAWCAPTNADLVELGYQDTLEAVAGTYALVQKLGVVDGGLKGLIAKDKSGDLIESVALGYLGYASTRLQEEGRASNDAEAVAIVIADLLSYVDGEEMQIATVDDFVVGAARIVAQHRDSPLVQSIMKKAAERIVDGSSGTAGTLVAELLGGFSPSFKLTTYLFASTAKQKAMMQDALTCYLAACYEGPQQGTSAAGKYPDAFSARKAVLYNDNILAAASLMGVDTDALKSLLGTNSNGQVDGSRPFIELVEMGLGALLSQKDENGTVVQYASLDELSNVKFARGISTISAQIADAELAGYLNTLAGHPTQAKDLLFNTLFRVEGQPFSTNYNIVVFSTLLYNKDILTTSHYGEIYVAWARAVRKTGLADYDHTVEPPRTRISIPTAKNRTYNGKSQTGVAKGEGYVVTGTRTAANAGTYAAYVTPDDTHCWPDGTTGKKKLTWKISAKAITPTVTLAATSYEYDGTAQNPNVTVKSGKTTLAQGTDYTVKYASGRTEPGTYAVKVTLKGNYSGTKSVKFKVVEAHAIVREDVAALTDTVTMYLPAKGPQTDARAYTYTNGKLKKLSSSNNAIVSCSALDGLLTLIARKQGTATITYTYKSKKYSAKVVVGKYTCPVSKIVVGSTDLTSKFSSSLEYATSVAKLKGKKIQASAKKGWTLVGIYAATKTAEKYVANGGKIPKDTDAGITITLQNKSTKGYAHLKIA